MANPLAMMFNKNPINSSSLQTILLNQLKTNNPSAYNILMQARNSGQNPQAIAKQMMQGTSPEQLKSIIQQARQYGIPDSVLSELENLK